MAVPPLYLVGAIGFEPTWARPQTECLTSRLHSDKIALPTLSRTIPLLYYSCQTYRLGQSARSQT